MNFHIAVKTPCLWTLTFSPETSPCNLQGFFHALEVCGSYVLGEAVLFPTGLGKYLRPGSVDIGLHEISQRELLR